MAENEGGSEQDDVSFLRTEDMVCLSCNATGERVCLAAEGFGNRTCFLEGIADRNKPPDLAACVFVIEQALSVRALQELVTAAASDTGKGTGSGHRTLLYGNAVLLRHQNSDMYLACLSTSSSKDKLAFDVGLQEHCQGEACWWTIHPASKQRSEGEKVRVGDDLILVSVATERYLQATLENEKPIVNASFHVTHWSVSPFGTGLSRVKYVGYVFGGEVLRFFHGGDECLTIPSNWSVEDSLNIVVYEGGSVVSQARSLWRLELARTKWSGGYINWFHPMRIRHITTGRYLGINENSEIVLLHRTDSTVAATTFYLREEKDDNKVMLEDKDLEVIGTPLIKYGDSTVIVQHIESGLWLSYKAFETKKKGVGKVEVKQVVLHDEGKMDDGLEFSRSQDEESRTARVIRKCSSLFTKFTKQLDQIRSSRRHSVMLSSMNLKEIVMCLEDLINYFAQPDAEMEHEERQIKLRALRNRQDLCQEEGILNLILDAIDKITVITSEGYLVSLAGEESGQMWDIISNYLYQLLAAMIKGNHNNCAQFANSMRLNWLFSRLGSQAGGEGMLDVLHCVLIDSPEALNVMKEEHIKVIISILEKHGRDPKVLDVLRSLCVGNGVAVRSSQNNICDYLLPGKSLLLQTALVDHVSSVHPNIYVGKVQGSSMYLKWYYEVTVDHIEQASHMPSHLRMGWANTMGYIPYPGGGEKWGGNGVGDDLYSFGFDGANLWTGGRKNEVFSQEAEPYIRKNDVVGVLLDLTVPSIEFTFNGEKVLGCFRDFNLDGMFFPVISCSSKLSARFLLGGDHGRQKFEPPEGFSPVSECLLPAQQMSIDPCFHFGELAKGVLAGPLVEQEDPVFVPQPIDTAAVSLAHYVEQIRDRLAENIHEIWAMNKIDEGWRYGEERDDEYMLHPCLTQFERLPPAEKRYDVQLALQTLKTIMKLGYHITLDKPPNRIRSIRVPADPFMQSNGYKPAPLDLSQVSLTGKLEELVEKLAENTHMVWSKERIQQGWTYGLNEDMEMIRTPHLVPYRRVDEAIKKANRDTASEAVRTLLVYGYILDPPSEQHDEGPADDLLNGRANYRTYRAEKTYAVSSGKWYFEFEVLTDGPMKVGWARIDAYPGRQIGQDDSSWAFDGYYAYKHHTSQVDLLGRKWHVGDVVGCMLDLHDRTISFSLNGELMMDAMGGETAFSEVAGDAFVPACTLGLSQRTRLSFGHDVNALKFFTQCGLQEGYEPFCVNMTRPMTFWYTKDQPIFENVDEVENSPIDVTRIPAGSDSPPCLRISHATFETLEKANWEFLRLSLPVTCQTSFIDEAEKERRWHEIRIRQHRLRHEGRNRPPSALKQSMLESGFTMSDIKDLQNGYDAVEADEVLLNKTDGEKVTPNIPRRGSKMARAASEMDMLRGRAGKEKTPQPDGKKKERGKSPFRFFKKRDQSSDRAGKRGKSQDRVIPTLELPTDRGLGALGAGGSAVRLSQADMRLMPPQIPDRLSRQRLSIANVAQQPDGEQASDDIGNAFDAECLRLINEYYYGVRIFPGQDPAHVYVGWVTTQYHIHGTTFSQEAVRKVTVAATDGYGQLIGDSVDRHSCYMVRADDLLSEVSADASGKGASQGMSIGCSIDTSTGVIAFTCEGKETNIKFKMEPGVKLFPAVFVEATSKEVLQIELGRTPTSLPLSAAVLQSSEKHVLPQFPPRLKFQLLKPHQWARVPNQSLRVHALKLSDIRGWSIYCEDPVPMLALHIPEEDRCIDILELIEHERLLSFHAHTLELYCAMCFQSNYRGAHILCHHVDGKQLLYAIQAEYMSGPLRTGFCDLLIAVHMESHANTMEVTSNEYVIPLGPELIQLYQEPGMAQSLSVQTTMSVQPAMATLPVTDTSEKVNELATPYFDFETVRVFVMEALKEAYEKNQVHTRDSIGGSNETLFVPLLKLCDRLLLIGYLRDEDIRDLLVMIDHASWDPSYDPEGKDQHRRGLLQIKMAEGCQLQICYLLHHLYDIQLRHRVESIIAFSHDYVGELQKDQLRRYVEIKQSELPSSVTARKTKEFRCPPREQMNSILSFKNLENIDPDDVSVGDDLIQQMKGFHEEMMKKISIVTSEEPDASEAEGSQQKSIGSTFLSVIGVVKKAEVVVSAEESEEQSPEDKFRRVLVPTIVRWAEESFIEDSKLIREMFRLLLRQYNAVGELMKALEKTYVINSKTSVDVASLWNFLSKIRSLLPVQMSPEEEELVRKLLWSLVNNHVFFQHPDLVRILRIHENVMAIMMNTLARRSQAENESANNEAEGKMAHEQTSASKDTSHEMVVACCRFLCYFCRTSRQNQKAMFDHLQFLLENSNILLSRPSLRGSTPLDVSYSSLMDNTELALALREHYLEKIAVYLSRCGLQSNSELVAKGYPDLGWDPVEGERYLDFLRFCVWVGGESVEENANLVIRLLIRRPECLGPALRGEGEGLLNAINQANKMAERIDAQNNGAVEADGGAFSSHPRPLSDDDEDYINTGAAILNFYCTLVDVMGRSSPEEFLIEQGKNESLRARAILRSLVPLSDLEGVLSLPFTLRDGEGEDNSSSDMPSGLIPSHKQSVVLFLERVYGIEDRELFFRLLEFAFLPDLRAATVLDKSDGGESDMGLALNRYIGNSILPLLIKHSRFYADADNYSSLLDATLHTVYRLSKNKILTKGQREAVSDFLVTLTRELHPGMMLKLLRKLTMDVSNITEYTTVALRLLTLHYDRCGRYYGSPNGQGSYGCASEEEKRLTMILFSNIFDSLAKMEYDPDLFGNALPCLTAIGCALPPDYSLTTGYEDELFRQSSRTDAKYIPQPIDTSSVALTKEMTDVIQKFGDHYHDAWSSRKLENGWCYSDEFNREERTHPRLKPPFMLSEYERERYRDPIRQALTALLALGWTVEYGEADSLSPKGSIRRSSSRQDVPPVSDSAGGGDPANYNPQPVDMTNLTLSREMQNMAERLAENAHDIWAKKTKHELEASAGANAHPMMVPYDLLTDKEKRKDRERCQELLKYLQFQGYKLARARTSRSDSETQEKAAAAATERRFAYSLLEKLQQYLGSAALNMKVLVPSQNLGHRVSFKRSSRDVKFFFKVVLPLMEKYFSTNRSYFIAVPTVTNMVGAASLKEKEMVANVFCKLAHLLRMKMSSFSSDTRLAVRCLTVLVRAVDARSLAKQCPEFVRTSMLTFFNHAAEDVGTTVQHLQEVSGFLPKTTEKYSYIRGTHLKTSSCLNYVQLVLFPVLTAFFEHLVVCEYGTDLLLDEIQVACYKLFHGLYQLGTDPNLSNQRKFIKAELDRHRPSLGTCLGAFAACFPVAFLEPDLNQFNQYSIHGRLQERSLEAQEVMARLEAAVPTLEEILKMVEKFSESGGKYEEARHIVDSLLPMLCSYLPFWWSQGPDNLTEGETQNTATTRVTDGHMNQLLKNILLLIKSNIGSAEAPWMTRIAGYAQQIIVSCSPDLLYDPYLPLAEKVRRRTEAMYHKEENLRGFLKSTTEDTSQVEGALQEMWYLLVRDIYAFYPLLIKYVDLQRSHWLKDCVPEAEDLYNHVAVIFEIWSKSQYFTREETNFISQNEIDNMTLIRPTTTARRTTTAVSEPSAGRGKKKKKRGDKKKSKDKDVASSLMVACLKRLLPVGLNLFAGREQEMVQHAKDRYLKGIAEYEIVETTKAELTMPERLDPTDSKSWQHHLYSKLGGGARKAVMGSDKAIAEKVPTILDIVQRIVDMAKVLYGLHMIDHPQLSRQQVQRSKLSVQRKRAVIQCFRQASLHQMTRHRAVNLFLQTYSNVWLSDENSGQEVLIEDLTQSFEDSERNKKTTKEEDEEETPDPVTQLVTMFSRQAQMEQGPQTEDLLYMDYAVIMAKSCGEEEEEGGDEAEGEEGGEGDTADAMNEQEIEKQKLLFCQDRLSSRGVAEMVLLNISASKGQPSEMTMNTLDLGISILRGGNVDVQMAMLNYLKEKKDSSFFVSISGLMSSCSVLDLDAFERNTKAEGLGVGSEGAAGEKNMHDDVFTCAVFRFLQLTCEGHNLDWQNYLRTQAGNTTTVNLVICTVDYLLRLQESIMDFYWHYSSKEIIDVAGKANFFKAISVASQVFNTLTEVIQGPCVGNQQALAHSRLWDAVGGFLFLFSHMQDKLSRHASQVDLLRELLNLQQDMIIMMLSMLEGNVVNGTIGKQMVDTLVESASNVEMILKFFDMFLKLKDLTESTNFQDIDQNNDGMITAKEFKDKMEQTKSYTTQEINFLIMCCDENHDGKIDYLEFTERFHNPAKEIGFNLAVLLTNLSEHMPNDPRLARFLETAGSVLNYFETLLGRIEILNSNKKIERVYFEIKQEHIEQWEKPQIKQSKRDFFYTVVTEGGDKEKLELFVDFCEDAIFEMQHATSLMGEEEDAKPGGKSKETFDILNADEEEKSGMDLVKSYLGTLKDMIFSGLSAVAPANIKRRLAEVRRMKASELVMGVLRLVFYVVYYTGWAAAAVIKYVLGVLNSLMQGERLEKPPEKREDDVFGPMTIAMTPAPAALPLSEPGGSPPRDGLGLPIGKLDESGREISETGATPAEGAEATEEPKSVVESAKEAERREIEKQQAAVLEEKEETGAPTASSDSAAVAQVDLSEYVHRVVSFLARNFYNLKYIALVLAFGINFMLLFYKASALLEEGEEEEEAAADLADQVSGSGSGSGDPDIPGSGDGADGDGDDEEEDGPEWIHVNDKYPHLEHVVRLMSIIHSIVSLFMLVAYYHLKVPLGIFKREKEVCRKLEFDGLYLASQPEDDDLMAHWDKLVISAKMFPANYWDKFVKKRVRQKYSDSYDFDQISNLLGMERSVTLSQQATGSGFFHFITSIDWRYQLWKIGVTFTDNAFLYSLWYFVFSILGNYNYFFFAAHLLDVAVAVPSLKTILQSVTHNGKQLCLTLLLLTIVVYIYTVIAFNFFRKFYVQAEDDNVDQKCHDMFTCFVFHLYQGVRAGGGIGDVIDPPDGDLNEVYRILFDISFFFFVIVILLAIIQGLIIDAFGELRDQLESVKEDMESNCFICGIGKDYFDNVPHGFETHVQKEHNLANYMFFLMHLINKDETEYTGQETNVWTLYQQRSWDFFPVGDCFRKQYEDELTGGGGGS